MSRYRKRPVEVEAFQLKSTPRPGWFLMADAKGIVTVSLRKGEIQYAIIHTPEGDHRAEPDDYIIQGVKGELYPCKPDIFEQTYEMVEES